MGADRGLSVLLTGATGFVGGAVSRQLRENGHEVRCAVRQGPARLDRSFVVGAIDGRTDWRAAVAGVDAVVHLAARVHVMRDTAPDPPTAFRLVNVEGTRRLAQQAAEAGVRRFVFVSSIKVNGEHTLPGKPFRASDPPAPEGPYAESKLEAELALREISAATGMQTVVVRPPLVYGPGVGANFLAMMKWLHRGVPLPLGGVDNRRSMVFIENLADLICVCVDHSRAANQVFLASDGEDLSVPDLLRRLAAALRVRARLIPIPVAWLRFGARALRQTHVFDRLCRSSEVDLAETQALLSWRPPRSVDEGLSRTAKHYLEANTR